MKAPYLTAPYRSRELTEVFGGYDHRDRGQTGTLYDECNMTADSYPALAVRRPRGVVRTLASPQALTEKDALCWVDGADLYCNGSRVPGLTLSTLPGMCPKTLVSMGAYIVIFPDKVYYNTADPEDKGYLEADNSVTLSATAKLSVSMCRSDGTGYGTVTASPTAPVSPTAGQYWLDTSGESCTLRQWAAATSVWTAVVSTFVSLSCPGIGPGLARGDGVDISLSGVTDLPQEVSALLSGAIIEKVTDGMVVIPGIISGVYTFQGGTFRIRRSVPEMDFVTESENRLWGCRYGTDGQGNTLNEIYCCAQGDFRNWRRYAGISTDSYAVTVGTDGAWTGAVTYRGIPTFFKENYIHKVYGSYPAEYSTITTACPGRGVAKGCGDSLKIVSGRLMYKAAGEVVSYDGSLPQPVSEVFGGESYSDASAGVLGDKYYVNMKSPEGDWKTMVYDSSRGLWHVEDGGRLRFWCTAGAELYAVDDAGRLISVTGGSGTPEQGPEWFCQTGNMGFDTPDAKYPSRINLRLQLQPGARADVYIQYDSDGVWRRVANAEYHSLFSVTVPVFPRRCDHFSLKISGRGGCRIYSLVKVTEYGGDGP